MSFEESTSSPLENLAEFLSAPYWLYAHPKPGEAQIRLGATGTGNARRWVLVLVSTPPERRYLALRSSPCAFASEGRLANVIGSHGVLLAAITVSADHPGAGL